MRLDAGRLELVARTREEVRLEVERMNPVDRAELSFAWLALLEKSAPIDPWVHGFRIVHRSDGKTIGSCGFKGPPQEDGSVEIAYGIDPEHQGKGYATEAAAALIKYAFSSGRVRLVRAHTLPEAKASARVLSKCGFHRVGEVIDPDDGLVWRWETSESLGDMRLETYS